MRPILFLLVFFHIFSFSRSLAAPTTSSSSDSASGTASVTASLKSNSSSSHSPTSSQTSTRVPIHQPHPHPTANGAGTHPLPIKPSHTKPLPNPAASGRPHPDTFPHPGHRSGQRPIAIVFEVLGGICVGFLLLSFLRCCNNYRKTPRRDRIADVLQRHNLQRELEELERNPRVIRRPPLPEPAPPYFPRPPSYEIPSHSEHHSSLHSHRSERSVSPSLYSAVSTFSPPSTPHMIQVSLPSTAANRRGHAQLPRG